MCDLPPQLVFADSDSEDGWGVPPCAPAIPIRDVDADKRRPPFHLREANIVATFMLCDSLHLVEFQAWCCKFVSSNKMSATMRLAYPKATLMIFGSGRALVIGSKYEQQSLATVWMCVHLVRSSGFEQAGVFELTFDVTQFKMRNIASSLYLPFGIHMFMLRDKCNGQLTLGQFPGCIMKFALEDGGKRSMTCFASGCINATGASSTEDTIATYQRRLEDIKECLVFGDDKVRLLMSVEKKRKRGF